MKNLLFLLFLPALILNINCSSTKYAALDQLKYDIYADSIEVLNVDTLNTIPPEDYVEVVKMPRPIYSVPPVYPELAKQNKVEGTVWVKMWLTKNGNVRRGIIMQSENKILNTSAMRAAIQWHFSPALNKDGQAKDIWVSIPFKFYLNK